MKRSGSPKRLIIPFFVSHQGCPQQCVFCNQKVISDQSEGLPSVAQIRTRIALFLRTFGDRPRRREVAFYGGSFTALPLVDQSVLLGGIQPFIKEEMIDAIRVSTRPDAIDTNRLGFLRDFKVETVEVGAQSMVDEILQNCQRGHTSRDVIQSVQLAKSMGFETGIQIMLGLPGEDKDLFLKTVRQVIDLAPDFVRIYPLLVLKGSPLEELYRIGLYTPPSLREAVDWAKVALGLFEEAQIPVIRMGLQATSILEAPGTILAGPYHPAFRSLVESSVFYDMACRLLEDSKNGSGNRVRFRIAPQDLSKLKGERKGNLARLKEAHGLESIEIHADSEIPRWMLVLDNSRGSLRLSRDNMRGFQIAKG